MPNLQRVSGSAEWIVPTAKSLLVFNPSRRYLDRWVRASAKAGKSHSWKVLDAGAGESPYRRYFAHVTYQSADFVMVDKPYVRPTYECDLTDIPVRDSYFDQVLCTQVMEHVPSPDDVLSEFRRILRPGGTLWLSAPLFYEEHEAPYDFYRYTRFAWSELLERNGFEVQCIDPLEGYFATLAYQLVFAARHLPGILFPLRIVFFACGFVLAWLELLWRIDISGMCKNYKVVAMKPAAAASEATPEQD